MGRARRILLWLLVVGWTACGGAQALHPYSPEAWAYAVARGEALAGAVFEASDRGLRCRAGSQRSVVKTIEALAAEQNEHPARIAEELGAYLWNDWTLLAVDGYDIAEVISPSGDTRDLETFLEAAYHQHGACLFGLSRVLVDGYLGAYRRTPEGGYRFDPDESGERYPTIAFEPYYFPGTGIFEPLGLIYAVRLSELLTIGWLRQRAIERVVVAIERRIQDFGDPLTLSR